MEFQKLNDLERSSIIVQYINTEPIEFYPTVDGTDLVQDVLRRQLSKNEENIFGADGSISLEDGEFLKFLPADTRHRTLHIPIEQLAYCGALRRMKRSDDGDHDGMSDNVVRREFENVDLANRYPQLVIGPPVFVAIFFGFDNALCYTFLTQNTEDARLLVMKLMRAYNTLEARPHVSQGQQQTNLDHHHHHHQSSPPNISPSQGGLFGAVPQQKNQQQPFFSSPSINTSGGSNSQPIMFRSGQQYNMDNDAIIQRLLQNPNVQMMNPPFTSHLIDDIPVLSPSSTAATNMTPGLTDQLSYLNLNPGSGFTTSGSGVHLIDSSSAVPSICYPTQTNEFPQDVSLSGTPHIIYKPNNQEVVYKQNIMVRWLQPPTPPPPAPIIIREIQPVPEQQPPIICRQVPPSPPTPPPIVVRERPPMMPPMSQPLVIEKRLPPINVPRQVIIERFPPPPPKPPAIIYEKYLPQQPQRRPVIVQRERCVQQAPRRRVIVRTAPQSQTANICVPQTTTTTAVQQQQPNVSYVQPQPQVVQQLVPVFATQQRVIQPKGVRVVRQVIGPAQQQQSQIINSPPIVQAFPANAGGYIPTGVENAISYAQPALNQIATPQQYMGQPQFTYVTS